MKPLLECPHFLAWVANTVAALSDMTEHPCGLQSKGVLTSAQTRIERLSSHCVFSAQQATALAAQFAITDLSPGSQTLH